MTRFSVIIPERDSGALLGELLSRVADVLQRRGGGFEILCVDHGCGAVALRQLQGTVAGCPQARLLRLDRACGTAAALSAGIAAARGETIIAIEASGQYAADDIPRLVERLSRADLVAGRRRHGAFFKLGQRLALLPRRVLLGMDGHDPGCLFWVARREAVQGFELARGMERFLPTLVSSRGFRVAELYVTHRPARRRWRAVRLAYVGDLLATWWWRRRWQAFTAIELTGTLSQPRWDGADNACHGRPPHFLSDRPRERGADDRATLATGRAEPRQP